MIKRLYNSLKSQTYKNWNWWIIDDSENNETIEKLNALDDFRITILKNVTNHGCIGFNKHMIAMMCDGDYLVEVDHDDELLPDCLMKLYECFKASDADFVYSDTMEYIDGMAINYGDGFSYGQGYYRDEIVKGVKYSIAVTTSSINAKSIRGIHAMPNHVRCWKKDFYHKIGGHNTELSVIDDMDLISRTFLYGRMAKVDKVLYIQHEGVSETKEDRGNTTTNKRFKEIQRINYLLYNKYDKQIHERILELGFEDPVWDDNKQHSDLNKKIDIKDLPIMDVLIMK
jgi:glycosyltransferase involved in cell wall biosynthesis